MQFFEKISDQDLLHKTIVLVKEERRVGIEVLKHLAEVERRALHLREGYFSLWEYCTQALGYSEGAAHRRISSMRLLVSVPLPDQKKIETSISDGRLSLTSLAQVQNFAMAKKREEGVPVSVAEKMALVKELEGKSSREAERILIAKAPDSYATKERVSAVTDTQTRVSLVVGNELIEKLSQLKAAHAHRLKKFTLEEVISLLADDALKAIEKKRTGEGIKVVESEKKDVRAEEGSVASSAGGLGEIQKNVGGARIAIPAETRRKVWKRAQGICEYQSQTTGKRCQSIHALQIDHIVPIAATERAENAYENLRLYCAQHNRASWREWVGMESMHFEQRPRF